MSVSLAYLKRRSAYTGFSATGVEKVVGLGEMATETGTHATAQNSCSHQDRR